jgi:hypothetical protein
MSNHYPGYAFLGYNCWVRREQIPQSLLASYDQAWAIAEANPSQIDPVSGRAYGAIWLDTADAIRTRVNPLLDRVALRASLQLDDLRKRGDQRKLDEILSPRIMRQSTF